MSLNFIGNCLDSNLNADSHRILTFNIIPNAPILHDDALNISSFSSAEQFIIPFEAVNKVNLIT